MTDARDPGGICPDRETLADFDLGRLPEGLLEAIAAHLAGCERCEGLLHGLQRTSAEDRFIVLLKRSLEQPELDDDSLGLLTEALFEEFAGNEVAGTLKAPLEARGRVHRAPRGSVGTRSSGTWAKEGWGSSTAFVTLAAIESWR